MANYSKVSVSAAIRPGVFAWPRGDLDRRATIPDSATSSHPASVNAHGSGGDVPVWSPLDNVIILQTSSIDRRRRATNSAAAQIIDENFGDETGPTFSLTRSARPRKFCACCNEAEASSEDRNPG
jgi:hypothetical protein